MKVHQNSTFFLYGDDLPLFKGHLRLTPAEKAVLKDRDILEAHAAKQLGNRTGTSSSLIHQQNRTVFIELSECILNIRSRQINRIGNVSLLEVSRLTHVNHLSIVTINQLCRFRRADFRPETLTVEHRKRETGGSNRNYGQKQVVVNEKLHHFLGLSYVVCYTAIETATKSILSAGRSILNCSRGLNASCMHREFAAMMTVIGCRRSVRPILYSDSVVKRLPSFHIIAPFLCALMLAPLTAFVPFYGNEAHAATQNATTDKGRKSEATAREKKRVEGERASVEQKLNTLQAELQAKEARSEEASQALKNADQAISTANRRLRELRQERQQVEEELRRLRRSDSAVSGSLRDAEKIIAQIARAQFVNMQRSVWQDFVAGINPNSSAGDAGKLRYLARAQARAVEDLENQQAGIRSVSEERMKQSRELARIQREEEAERKDLLKEKRDRQHALGQLQSEIRTQQASIEKLKKDQARLSNLVSAIDARLEKERRQEEEAAKRQAAAGAKKNQQAKAPYVPQTGSFGKLKGRLTRPVKGRLTGSFGNARPDQTGAVWQGLQFQAQEGAEVYACAAGKVVFSDWLRGFGNLIIIDHGNTYMSIYANNEALFKNVGDLVKQGETISSVGSSGGVGEPGLYFELRYKGKPINPQPWFSPR